MTSTKECPLGKGQRGTISVTLTPTDCNMARATIRTVSVKSPAGADLLTMEFQDVDKEGSDFCPSALDPVIDVRCRNNHVEIFQVDGSPKVFVSLAFDTETQTLGLVGRMPMKHGWQRPPASGRERVDRQQLHLLLEAARRGSRAAIDDELVDQLGLLIARDKVAAGDWRAADEGLAALNLHPYDRNQAAVRKLLKGMRARSVPVKVTRLRLGTTQNPQTLPLDAGVEASLFWLEGELCVIQEDDPPRAMRCYSPTARSWGASRPLVRPASDGRALKVLKGVGKAHRVCTERDKPIIVPRSVPEEQVEICGDYEGAYSDELVAVVEGSKMLLLREDEPNAQPDGPPGFELDPGLHPARVDGGQAASLARGSAGTTLVGGGCCIFRYDGTLRLISWDRKKTWDVRGEPPEDEAWIDGPPLASPDQRWAVAQSISKQPGGNVTLWLLRIEPK